MRDVVLALVAAAQFGALSVAVRVGQRGARDPSSAAVATGSTAAAIVLAAALVARPGRPDLEPLWPFLVAGAAVPGVSQFLFQRAVHESGASRPTVVLGLGPLLSITLAALVLGESIGVAQALGTVAIVGGTVLLASERRRPEQVRTLGLVLAGVCAVLFAMRDNVVRAAADNAEVPALHAGVASLAAGVVVGWAVLLAARGPAAVGHVGASLRPMLPAGLLFGGAYATLVAAFAAGPVTTVAPLATTQVLWAVLVAWLVLGRSEAIGLRLVVAAALVVAGGMLIGAFR